MVKINQESLVPDDFELIYRSAESEYEGNCMSESDRGSESYSNQVKSNGNHRAEETIPNFINITMKKLIDMSVLNEFQPRSFKLIKKEIKVEPEEIQDNSGSIESSYERTKEMNLLRNTQNSNETAESKPCVIDINIKQLIDMTVFHKFQSKRPQLPKISPCSVKPKRETISRNNKQPIIKLNKNFLKQHFRTKWIDLVKSTFHRQHIKNACQLCHTKILFKSSEQLIKHYAECHSNEITWHNCTLCTYSKKQECEIIRHWENKHKKFTHANGMFTISKKDNALNNIWTGDDELVRSMFQEK